ncbi:type I-F CRISPR-associated endoribonuclease Cas6/Csy4 [Chimaeribacter arupi]|uniref:Type I-F CRISPR-associated endoribonuclease Cas6/Csy4 n=1 Tax=Chimaeribacter arupi TaxID=2060066 RepID=A0A2N5EI14_9GAMM|nr:type I-F CRISPR-associated endoribonuclease Cas6/Csy4 [Chimaeribacter arupi]PLR44021.1 type I-F CRISPR-associated endoribonuclease Cas6/Csy4 [Chimaeribacter arupi]
MDHFLEIRVLPDPEFTEETLMSALFAKLHRALAAHKQGDIGVSFPAHDVKPGPVLRLHGTQTALHTLESLHWRTGLSDYCAVSAITQVSGIKGWRTVSRVQVKSSAGRLLRRSVKKGWISEAEAAQRLENSQEQRSDLPWLAVKSLSSGHHFRLFIRHGELQPAATAGEFSCYGLSNTATIPWF